jgi:hypothetical protein
LVLKYELKFFDVDPGSGIFSTLDLVFGMGKFGTGIRDNHPGSAILPGAIYPIYLAFDASGLGEVPLWLFYSSLCSP